MFVYIFIKMFTKALFTKGGECQGEEGSPQVLFDGHWSVFLPDKVTFVPRPTESEGASGQVLEGRVIQGEGRRNAGAPE